jgi:hypothetical protein
MTKETELNDQHDVGGIQRSSKSRPRRKPAARAQGYRTRLNDTAVRKPKRLNAQKHGVFTVNPVMPGEDPREFEQLHSALIDEWQPCGPTEEDAVFGLADAMWRKLRSQKFLRARLVANTFDPNHPAFDETYGLHMFCVSMHREPETAFEENATSCLRPDKVEYLKQKFPRANYQTMSEWANAILNEIETVLLPAIPNLEPPKAGEKVDYLIEGMRRTTAEMKLFLPNLYASEFFEHDLNLRERLDARIARLVKHLVQTKAMKQMLRQTPTDRAAEQPRKIAAKSPSGS